MGHSSSVYAIAPPDAAAQAHFLKMKAVWDACILAGVAMPEKVAVFFDCKTPGEGLATEVTRLYVGAIGAFTCSVRPYGKVGSGEEGFEVDLDRLPAGTKIIRFVCRW